MNKYYEEICKEKNNIEINNKDCSAGRRHLFG